MSHIAARLPTRSVLAPIMASRNRVSKWLQRNLWFKSRTPIPNFR